ncbi:MAG TPA: DNRLRE domain-containing protein [Planctomycetota bacterium]|nr:DNRLRE domain-containing protein [Planctomycetota bacterium]
MPKSLISSVLLLCGALLATSRAQTLTLGASQDNTLYESATGNLSNGQGLYLFAGINNVDQLRRGLLRFDVAAALPAGATITAVELRLAMSKTGVSLPKPVSLHRALSAWGEGGSNAAEEEGVGACAQAGDATWLYSFLPGHPWGTPGGDHLPGESAVEAVGLPGSYTWESTPALVADVQLLLDQPAQNHGWILLGDESGGQSAKRFDSRQHTDPAARPELVVHFDLASGCAGGLAPYGAGLAGTGGLAPTLSGSGCPQPGGAFTLRLTGGLGGAGGALFVGLVPASIPFKGGSFLVGSPVLQLGLLLGGAGGAPGGGSLLLPASLPADPLLQGLELRLQAALVDGGASGGIALTNGLRVLVG